MLESSPHLHRPINPQLQPAMASTLNEPTHTICRKYNHCIPTNNNSHIHAHSLPFNQQQSQSSFEFPSNLLHYETPLQLEVQPVPQIGGQEHWIDQLVQRNVNQKKRDRLLDKKLKEEKDKERKRNLEKLAQDSKRELEKYGKRPVSGERRPEWNHSIYGLKEQKQRQHQKEKQDQQKSRHKQKSQHETSQQKKPKMELKPITTRIMEYKHLQQSKQKQHQHSQACKHFHSHPTKNPQEINKQIEKRAFMIQKQAKEEKDKIVEERKLRKAKIRAIQIQSRASLGRCGKKPVDPTVEFVVEVIPSNENKKKNVKKSKQGIQNFDQNTIQGQSGGLSKTGSSKNSRRQLKQIKKNANPSKSNKKQQQKAKAPQNTQQQSVPKGKFYFWDMPIYPQDCQIFDLTAHQTHKSPSPAKSKPFRTEVQQYLYQKQRSKMQAQNQAAKVTKFNQLVQQKKQQFLLEFESSNSQNNYNNSQEIFWNEDELFKMEPISNFRKY